MIASRLENILKFFKFNTLILIVFGLFIYFPLLSQQDSTKRSILLIDDPDKRDSLLNDRTVRPGDDPPDYNYSPVQDIHYKDALNTTVPALTRLELDLKVTSEELFIRDRIMENDPWAIARANLDLPPEYFQPSGQEVYQRQINIMNSQYVPFVRTLNMYGTQISFETIGKLFGLVEDVSPTIKFSLEYSDRVEIKIYSVTAVVVRTLYSGYRRAGDHTITWNFRDDQGRMMPAGDYIAEIRIGDSRYIRKRIVKKN